MLLAPADLLRDAALGSLSPASQQTLIEALVHHIETGEALGDILGLHSNGSGQNPRTVFRLARRDFCLRTLWAGLEGLSDIARAEVAADLLRRLPGAIDGPADDLERTAAAVLYWNENRPLSASRIRAICTA